MDDLRTFVKEEAFRDLQDKLPRGNAVEFHGRQDAFRKQAFPDLDAGNVDSDTSGRIILQPGCHLPARPIQDMGPEVNDEPTGFSFCNEDIGRAVCVPFFPPGKRLVLADRSIAVVD